MADNFAVFFVVLMYLLIESDDFTQHALKFIKQSNALVVEITLIDILHEFYTYQLTISCGVAEMSAVTM